MHETNPLAVSVCPLLCSVNRFATFSYRPLTGAKPTARPATTPTPSLNFETTTPRRRVVPGGSLVDDASPSCSPVASPLPPVGHANGKPSCDGATAGPATRRHARPGHPDDSDDAEENTAPTARASRATSCGSGHRSRSASPVSPAPVTAAIAGAVVKPPTLPSPWMKSRGARMVAGRASQPTGTAAAASSTSVAALSAAVSQTPTSPVVPVVGRGGRSAGTVVRPPASTDQSPDLLRDTPVVPASSVVAAAAQVDLVSPPRQQQQQRSVDVDLCATESPIPYKRARAPVHASGSGVDLTDSDFLMSVTQSGSSFRKPSGFCTAAAPVGKPTPWLSASQRMPGPAKPSRATSARGIAAAAATKTATAAKRGRSSDDEGGKGQRKGSGKSKAAARKSRRVLESDDDDDDDDDDDGEEGDSSGSEQAVDSDGNNSVAEASGGRGQESPRASGRASVDEVEFRGGETSEDDYDSDDSVDDDTRLQLLLTRVEPISEQIEATMSSWVQHVQTRKLAATGGSSSGPSSAVATQAVRECRGSGRSLSPVVVIAVMCSLRWGCWLTCQHALRALALSSPVCRRYSFPDSPLPSRV